jgi:VanZ family protein
MLQLIKKNLKTTAILWSVFIFFLLAFPARNTEGNFLIYFPGIDKLIHVLLFAVYSRLWFLVFYQRKSFRFLNVFLIFLSGSVFGWLMECIQLLPLVNRDYEWSDLAADTLGAGFVFFFRRK